VRRIRQLALVVLMTSALIGIPATSVSAGSHKIVGTPKQTVELRLIKAPTKVKGGGIQPYNVVSGTCGSASMWVTDNGVETARFNADASSNQGIITKVDWTIDWWNATTGPSGTWFGTTSQFSPTWGVVRSGWVDSGLVYGKLTRLTAFHLNGAVCQGLVPWDWEQVN
jgi:hypothetical protein